MLLQLLITNKEFVIDLFNQSVETVLWLLLDAIEKKSEQYKINNSK